MLLWHLIVIFYPLLCHFDILLSFFYQLCYFDTCHSFINYVILTSHCQFFINYYVTLTSYCHFCDILLSFFLSVSMFLRHLIATFMLPWHLIVIFWSIRLFLTSYCHFFVIIMLLWHLIVIFLSIVEIKHLSVLFRQSWIGQQDWIVF